MWLNHHSRALFPLPNPEQTSINDQANWSYDDDIDAKGDDEVDHVEAQP